VNALLQDAREAAQFLREFVVQGAWLACRAVAPRQRSHAADRAAAAAERNAAGNFAVQLQQSHAGKQVEVPRLEEDTDSDCCSRPK
jgi:hypothetical protein